MQDIGYEAANVTHLNEVRAARDGVMRDLRQSLQALCIEAMLGERTKLPHVERRLTQEVEALAPLAEVVAECMDTHVVHRTLIELLRDCPLAADLRTAIAHRYAEVFAPRLATLRGLS
jgi:hypothetical protein